MELKTLSELFVSQLRELYWAENQLCDALPTMAKAASSRQLRRALKDHLKETAKHAERLDRIFADIGIPASGRHGEGIKGLIRQGEGLVGEGADPEVRDAGLISAAQKLEHYEIAAYGTVRTYAELLGRNDVAKMLQLTLNEEKRADHKLTAIAERVNAQAQRHRSLRNHAGVNVGGFTLGLGLGAVLGMLLAPISGKELRERASNATRRAGERISEVSGAPQSRQAGD
jgi:ferritin-like metal-binding protein YciE